MANEGLKLLVTADVTQAEKALKDFTQTAQTQGAKAGSSFGKGLNDANGSLANLPKTAKPAIKAIADIGDAASNSIIELKQLQKSLKGELSGLSKNQLGGVGGLALKKELSGVTAELKTLEKQAGISGKATAGSFQKTYGVVRQLANILPGIGIAGIIGLAATAVEELIRALVKLDKAPTPFQNLKESIMGAKDEFVRAASSVSQLENQIQLAKKGFIDKDAVVKQYNDTIGKTTGFVTTLEEAEKALQRNKDAYIQMTLQKAVANYAYGKAAEEAFKAQTAGLNDNVSNLNKGKVVLQNFFQTLINPVQGAKRALQGLNAEQEKGTAKAVQAAKVQEAQYLNIAKNAEAAAAELSKANGFSFFDAKPTKKAADNIIAEAKRVADYFNDRSIRDVKVDFLAPTSENEAKNKQIARDFLKKFNKDFRSAIQEFGFDFNVRPEVSIDTDGAEFRKNIQTQGQKAINALQDEIGKLKKSKLLLEFDIDLQTAEKRGQEFAQKLGVSFENLNSLLNDAQKQTVFFANTIANTLGGAFQSLTQAITAGENPIKAFFQSIGQSVLQLVQKLLQAAIQAAILNAIFGAAGFSAGGKTIKGFGGFFKNIVGFASGGIVSGPTLAMVGEGRGTSRSNPEVIAPLDQLRGMIQGINTGGQVSGRLSARVRGNDILLSNERTSRSNRRLGAR